MDAKWISTIKKTIEFISLTREETSYFFLIVSLTVTNSKLYGRQKVICKKKEKGEFDDAQHSTGSEDLLFSSTVQNNQRKFWGAYEETSREEARKWKRTKKTA